MYKTPQYPNEHKEQKLQLLFGHLQLVLIEQSYILNPLLWIYENNDFWQTQPSHHLTPSTTESWLRRSYYQDLCLTRSETIFPLHRCLWSQDQEHRVDEVSLSSSIHFSQFRE